MNEYRGPGLLCRDHSVRLKLQLLDYLPTEQTTKLQVQCFLEFSTPGLISLSLCLYGNYASAKISPGSP